MKRLIIITFIILALLRIVHLGADPPVARTEILENVGEFYYDEGWWSLGVRDLLLFNNPDHAHFNAIPLTPVSSAVYFISFKILGINLYSLRLVGVVASLIALWFFFKTIEREDKKRALLAVIILGFNSLFLIYSRSGMLEMICLPFLMGAMLSYLNGRPIITGLLIGLAVITKVHAIFFIIIFLFLPNRLKTALGFFVIFIPWLFLVNNQPILAHYQSSRWLTTGQPILNGAKSLLIGLVYRDTFFRNNPLFFIFGLLAIPGLYRSKDHTSRLFFLWAVCGSIFFGIFPFQPARYLLLLTPPLTYGLIKSQDSKTRVLITIVAAIVVSQSVFGIIRPFIDNFHGPLQVFPGSGDYKLAVEIPRFLRSHNLSIYPDFFARMIIYILTAGGAMIIGIIVGVTWWRIFRPWKIVIPLIILVDLFLNLWTIQPNYSFLKFGRRIATDIQGEVAPAGTFSVMNRLDYDNLPVLKRDMDNPDLFPEFALLITRHPLLGRFSSERFFTSYRPAVIYSLFNNRYEVTLYERIEDTPHRP